MQVIWHKYDESDHMIYPPREGFYWITRQLWSYIENQYKTVLTKEFWWMAEGFVLHEDKLHPTIIKGWAFYQEPEPMIFE